MSDQANSNNTAANDEIDLMKLLFVFLNRKWLIISVTAIFAVIGVVVAKSSQNIYKADALIQVEKKSGGLAGLGDFGDMFAEESSATTELELIKSRNVLGAVVDKLKLQIIAEPVRFPVKGEALVRLLGRDSFLNTWFPDYAWGAESIEIERLDLPYGQSINLEVLAHNKFELSANEELLGQFSIGEIADFEFGELFVSNFDSEVGRSFVLSLNSRLLTIESLKRALSVSEKGKGSGILQLSYTGSDKQQNRKILNTISNEYVQQNYERLSKEADNSLEFLNNQIPNIKERLTESEDLLNQFRSQQKSVDLTLETKSILESAVQLNTQISELETKEAELSKKYTKEHPSYVALLEKKQALVKEKEKIANQTDGLPEVQQKLLRLTRDVEVNQTVYLQLLNSFQELQIVKAGTVPNVHVVDEAVSYPLAVKPNKALIVIGFIFLGGMLSVICVLLMSFLKRGVQTPDEIESLGLSVYATVPASEEQSKLNSIMKRKSKAVTAKEVLLASENPADLAIEALRGLRTSLHFAMIEAKNNVLMITGPSPGIGKSFVSANFAAVCAKTGQRTLVIDADMRRGHMEDSFGVDSKPGLSDFLANSVELDDIIKETSEDNLFIIPRGMVPPNPSELLMSDKFDQLIAQISGQFDLVIIDSPPILAVTDAAVIGSKVGTALLVARYEQTQVKEIDVSINRLKQSGVEVSGVILNGVEQRSAKYGYYGGNYNYQYSSEKN